MEPDDPIELVWDAFEERRQTERDGDIALHLPELQNGLGDENAM